ncbi:hypothetical protein Agub_g3856 [Astrephomene gubernaculifera]|uniref:Sulfotransferase n=1 Tax=Astrephomene gubernaculifera TaxID=47775 RepID=A0AAD3DJB8_9CHLO|nr:hypothetical protein Agub_g3856 [Astrephomene gubernaculifera]
MEAQCYARENFFGWSVYDVFLENYLSHFPQQQVMVLYTDDLASQPLEVFRRVEDFLGVRHHQYDEVRSALIFNSRDCYNWKCGKQKEEVQPLTLDSIDNTTTATESQQQQQQPQSTTTGAGNGMALMSVENIGKSNNGNRNSAFTQATARLTAFYRPHMQRLFRWADRGIIAQPPAAWRTAYG